MKIWTYVIESENSANPEVLLFTSEEAMQERFIKDILEDDRDPFAEEEDGLGLTLADLKHSQEPLQRRFELAKEIYEAIIEDGDEMPYYHGFNDGPTELEGGYGFAPEEGEPELHRLMVLSTGHLTDRDRKLLGELADDYSRTAGPSVFSDQYPYGFHLTLTDPDPAIEEGDEDPWPGPSIRACVEYARKHNCTHLRLDADGAIVKDLPTY